MIVSTCFFSDESVLLLIQDSIDELLLSLDVRQIDASLIWPVLRTLAQSCERWRLPPNIRTSSPAPSSFNSGHGTLTEVSREEGVPSHVTNCDESTSHVTDHVTPEAVEEFFLQYHREKQRQEEEEKLGDFSESELNQNEREQDEGAEEKDPYNQRKQLSPLSRTIVELMQRCGHHMSAEPPPLRLIVLETLIHCLVALKHEQVSTKSSLSRIFVLVGRTHTNLCQIK